VAVKASYSPRELWRFVSKPSIIFVFSSWSLRNARISDTRLACKVGVNRRGSRIEILSSFVTSFEFRREWLSPFGNGGGEDDGTGEIDFCREDRRELRDGVLYGVSVGVGRED
jgi:hypothetical protein